MRVIIERDPGQAGETVAARAEALIRERFGCDVQVVDRAVPQALITDRPDLAYQREVEAAGKAG